VAQQAREAARRQGQARLLQSNRQQVELRASDLESLLGEDRPGLVCRPCSPSHGASALGGRMLLKL
jgi:hypothetical protein